MIGYLGRNRRLNAMLSALVFQLGFSASAWAAATTRLATGNGDQVLISAETMFRDSETQTVELVGNVQVQFEGQVVRCDRATINAKKKSIMAQGNLVIASPAAYVEGRQAELSYADNTGTIYDGFVKSGQVLFEGRVIRKTGPTNYVAEVAHYTACTTCPPAWGFTGQTIDAEIGGYAFIKSSFLKVGGIPIFWFPYLIVPLKSERQTGVLFPLFDIESENFAISVPFFWAISRSQDLTVTPKWYTHRGFKSLFNYRYVLSDNSGGESNAGFFLFSDQVFSEDSNLPSRPGSERSGRWYVNHEHSLILPGGFTNKARLNFVSDLRYPRDFPEEISGAGDSALENSISLSKNTETMHSSIQAKYYINQLKQDPLSGNSDSVHRFPEIRQSGIDRSLFGSKVFFKWDIDYVNFAREDFAYDDVMIAADGSKTIDSSRGSGDTNSGSFQPNLDQIRTGQRLDIKPEISMPFRIGKYIDILPTVQARHTQYSFNVTSPPRSSFDVLPNRQSIKTRVDIRTQLYRIYDVDSEDHSNSGIDPSESTDVTEGDSGIFSALQPKKEKTKPIRLKHEIEPEFSIAGIPWLQQTDSAFFGDNTLAPIFLQSQPVSDSDFLSSKGLQFDYEDRITQRNIMSLVINNRLIKKSWSGEDVNYRQIVLVKNGTSYEFDKRDRNVAANFADIFTLIDVRLDQFETNALVRYFPLHNVADSSSRVLVRDHLGNFLQLSYSQHFTITENVGDASAKPSENIAFTIGFTQRYVTVATTFTYLPVSYSPIDFWVQSWSTTLDLRPPGDCWGFKAVVSQAIGETIKMNFAFNYNFGGAIR